MLLGCNHQNSGELYLCKSASQHKLAVALVGAAAAGICVLTLQFNVIQSDFLAASILKYVSCLFVRTGWPALDQLCRC